MEVDQAAVGDVVVRLPVTSVRWAVAAVVSADLLATVVASVVHLEAMVAVTAVLQQLMADTAAVMAEAMATRRDLEVNHPGGSFVKDQAATPSP